ncbi:vigilin-like isoform X1 [Hemiscyllium ocellatum]|uniref:vigilin-like isoform X1 n=1 Tax=Hemiscyllium ocellatum TaxID=170820 RepID=UPI002966B7DF|nr:vigilin-like isoform X1 [Hemiscyllium ocellatum]XP_060710803.1 vigilin-like isoform X1 [Hemiscyllium ocellatum]
MSSVAVLTPESFAEHRSGLGDQETRGGVPEDEAYIPTYLEAFPPLPEKGTPGDKSGEPIGAWSKIRPIKSSVITQVFHVPLEERRYKDNSQFGEGEEAKVCLDIMQKTGAHIELSLAKDQGLSIMVTGKLDSVMKARKEIVARLQTQASATVTIPKEHHRFVIGKNGEKLQELELKTATKINIPRPDDPSNQIKITGTKEGIEKSRHEILLISAEQDKRAVERINLEKVFHPFIAGAYNKVVQEIMQETGARINIPPPSINKDEIFITGEKEPVAQAGTRIRKIYEEKEKMVLNRGKQEHTGGGQSHLHVLAAVDETVTEKGIAEACDDAGEIKDEVSQELEPEEEDADGKRSKETSLPSPSVTGSKTDTAPLSEALLQVASECGEVLATSGQKAGQEERALSHSSPAAEQSDEDFDDPGYRRRLMDAHNQMAAALESLPNSLRRMARSMEDTSSNLAESFTQSLERVVTSVSTPADPTVSERLMADVTASIAAQAASVRGLSDAVAAQTAALQAQTAAIVALDATVRRGFQGVTATQQSVVQQIRRIAEAPPWKRKTTTISVEVKKSQHKYIIGPKGNTLQEILDMTGVSVEMPSLESSSETIILRGEPDKLGPALTQVYAKAKSVMVAEVTAPAWLHRFIIGKKGQNIGRITQQLPKVHIEFTDGDEKITLEGPTEEVEIAQTQIQDIINDLLTRMDYTEITVEQKYHRHLIGKNGANINRIKEQYKVSVRIPPDNEKSNLIRIEGEPQGVQLAKKELLEMAVRMENERTKDLIIEQRLHRSIIGQKGEKIKEVRDKFPEVIINFPDPVQKSDIVQLRGPKNEVEKCGKFLQKVIADLIENSYSVSIPIFKQFHKNIIGKGGANIKKIREETNTKIDLPTENSNSEVILITGKKVNCEAARDRILAIQRELANIKEVDVLIPAKLHNSLIGAKGRLVRSLMEECGGVHIHFPSEGSGSDKVTIRGPVEEVEKARKQLLQLAEEKQINNCTVELHAKPEYHKFLIGRGGGNIRRVRDRTGARIIFPAADDRDQELITIVGKEEAIKQAHKELEILIKNLDNVIEDLMIVDPKYHRHFVARRGQVLREIAEEYGGVTVSFPRTGVQSDRVVLKGAKDCVEAAKRRIQEIIGDLEAQVTLECVIPQRFHRAVMGLKGSKVQQITRDYDVQIKFPERDENQGLDLHPQENGDLNSDLRETEHVPRKCDVIVISGRKEKCEGAHEALLALVPVTVDVEVPFDLHRYIIGQKGSGIRKMMEEYEVNIAVPPPEHQSDVIKITGLAVNLERARAGILERVRELQAEQEDRALRGFKLVMSVDPKYHPKIIGRKGAVISQIRKDHDVNIQFPDKGDENQDMISITGYERNTESAKDAIMKIVADLEEMVSEDINLDHRVHARIIGGRGKAIRKIMEEFKVDIRFPPPGSDDPNRVTVTGLPEHVDNAIDHLLNLEEEYMMAIVESETMAAYMKPPSRVEEEPRGSTRGFVVRDAPWNVPGNKAPDVSSAEDFPMFGTVVTPRQASAWGPKKF